MTGLNKNKGRTCFIQSHYTNIRKDDLLVNAYSVQKLKESGIFEHIVVAGADLPENQILFEVAKRWGVECLLGSVDNMVERMLQVARATNARTVTRVLIDWFYIDTSLVQGMAEMLVQEGLDYVNLPYDFDIKFGADLHSIKGLKQVAFLFKEQTDLAKRYQFRPWFLIEENPFDMWSVRTYQNVPNYSNDYFYKLQKEIKKRHPIAWDFGPNFYYHEYMYARDHIRSTDVVLDIASGWGAGTVVLAEKCAQAIGMDIRKEYIEAARKRYLRKNIKYVVSDAMDIDLPINAVDVVVSVHTMEHLEDDDRFLSEISRVLKKDGKFIIEVPLRLHRPFVYNSKPFMPDHVREYEIEQLSILISQYFNIEAAYGVNRGYYCDLLKARNAAMFVCKKV